jgi:ParB-like chromosome segregation protein Spo0J
VVFDDGSGAKPIIIDGEHRWRVAQDPDVTRELGGLVPIVRIVKARAHRMMSTIRHNRARGEHVVTRMADVVRELLESGHAEEDICFLLQMEVEEVRRLADRAGMPERVARGGQEFSKGWVPG